MTEPVDAMLTELTTEAAVLRVYRQAFAVLAREAGAMILDAGLIDVDAEKARLAKEIARIATLLREREIEAAEAAAEEVKH